MNKIPVLVGHFFQDNRVTLTKFYPGLSSSILLREVENFLPQLVMESDYFSSHYLEKLHFFFSQLLQGIPLEYISGRKFFYKSSFLVTPEVLIPRNETELLVEGALLEYRLRTKIWEEKGKKIKVCDVGVGSGAILLSLLKEINNPILGMGIDLSPAALEVAKKNTYLLRFGIHPETEISFFLGDRLKGRKEKFHLILSNPPYIKKKNDFKSVHRQVSRFEPQMALYLDDNIYKQWYREFFIGIKNHLEENGLFYMEGHEDHLGELSSLAKELGFAVEVLNDYTQRPRFLLGSLVK